MGDAAKLQLENDRLRREVERLERQMHQMQLQQPPQSHPPPETSEAAPRKSVAAAKSLSRPARQHSATGAGGGKVLKLRVEELYNASGQEVGLVVNRMARARAVPGGGYESVSPSESESDSDAAPAATSAAAAARRKHHSQHRKQKREVWRKARRAFAKAGSSVEMDERPETAFAAAASDLDPGAGGAPLRHRNRGGHSHHPHVRGHAIQLQVSSVAEDLVVPLNCRSISEKLVIDTSASVLERLRSAGAVDAVGAPHITAVAHDEPVDATLRREVASARSAFYVMDLSVAVMKLLHWKYLFPRVRPHYAVKSNPDPLLCRTLFLCGAGFDCASSTELDLVRSMGAGDSDVIFANPVKLETHIEHARDLGVRRMTFDNVEEIDKIRRVFPEAQLVLRILPDDSHSMSPFGSKFGARKEDIPALLDRCKSAGANLVGVSFHVGSGCQDPHAFADAVMLAYSVFVDAAARGFHLTLLDIGGGWPGHEDPGDPITLESVAELVRPLFTQYFPVDVQIIAEPGRYFCTECVTLAVNVVGRREKVSSYISGNYRDMAADGSGGQPARLEDVDSAKEMLYYLSDGLYGSFTNIYWDHYHPAANVLTREVASGSSGSEVDAPVKMRSQLFGPTCDSIDIIAKDVALPELSIGDWLYFSRMGAYTSSAGTQFNGFQRPPTHYILRI